MVFETKAHMEVAVAEVFEAAGKFLCKTCNNSRRYGGQCSCGNADCGLVVCAKKNTWGDTWTCTKVHPFSCTGPTIPTEGMRSSNYTCAMLAPIVLDHVRSHEKASITTINTMLEPYIKHQLSRSRARRVLHLCLLEIHGGPEEGVQQIPAFLAALQEKGWFTKLLFQDVTTWYSDAVNAFSHLIDTTLYVPPVQVRRGKGLRKIASARCRSWKS